MAPLKVLYRASGAEFGGAQNDTLPGGVSQFGVRTYTVSTPQARPESIEGR